VPVKEQQYESYIENALLAALTQTLERLLHYDFAQLSNGSAVFLSLKLSFDYLVDLLD